MLSSPIETAEQSNETPSQRQRIVFLIVSVVVTIGVLLYLFQEISLGDVASLILGIDRRGVVMFLTLSLTMSVFRTWRYLILLSASQVHPPRVALFLVVLVRNLFADLLPARIGTLAYVALAHSRLGVPLGSAISSWGYSFLFDIIAICPLVLVAALIIGGDGAVSASTIAVGGICIGAIAALAMYALPTACEIAMRISRIFSARLERMVGAVRDEFIRARTLGIAGPVLFLSILIRVFKYAGLYVLLYALLAPHGYTFSQLNPAKVFIGISAAELSASLPISGIAGFGAYQGTWSLVFELMGFPSTLAKATSLSHHIFTQLYGYGLGLGALCLLTIPFWRGGVARERSTISVRGFLGVYTRAALVASLSGAIVLGIYGFQ